MCAQILPPELGGTGQLTGPDDVFALLDKGEQHPNVVAAKRAKAANGSANGARGAANGNGAAH